MDAAEVGGSLSSSLFCWYSSAAMMILPPTANKKQTIHFKVGYVEHPGTRLKQCFKRVPALCRMDINAYATFYLLQRIEV